MPNHVLQLDCTSGNGNVEVDILSAPTDCWVEFDIAFNANCVAAVLALGSGSSLNVQSASGFGGAIFAALEQQSGTLKWKIGTATPFAPSPAVTSMQFYHIKQHLQAGSPGTYQMWIDGVDVGTDTGETVGNFEFHDLAEDLVDAGSFVYYDNFQVGSTEGTSDLGSDDFEGGDLSFWDSSQDDASIIEDPGITPAGGGSIPNTGRVLIAFNDGPLEPDPAWTVIDQGGDFPQNFVSGYDIESGRQTLLSQTDTGTATVYIYDHEQALFDPRNVSSPYFGLLDGKQILLQLWDPEAEAWEEQFRGWIDDIGWEIDGSAVGADSKPLNASLQMECVDMFDYLAGFGLTPGLDGVTPQVVPSGMAGGPPPAGFEDGVYYAETAGTVKDRIIEILADVGIDPDRYLVASGNVSVKAVKYDPDESALQALRDAADAEFPFIANIYCDRHGAFAFRGRYSRFDPDAVAAEPGSTWDFTRWAVGDGLALIDDPTRAQIKTFAFGRNRSDLINVAICYPQDMKPAQMPSQVFANTASINAYGKHSAPPMSDLLVNEGSTTGGGFTTNDHQECFLYAKLLVLNQKDPRENITTLGLKSIRPDGSARSVQTWALMTRADISHIVNVAVGYPAGTGLAGASPEDDYYIEGRQMRVRPLNPIHDYVEIDYAVSPAVWSMDTNGVFLSFDELAGPPGEEVLSADFTIAY